MYARKGQPGLNDEKWYWINKKRIPKRMAPESGKT